MRLPVPKFLAMTSAHVQIADGTDENGALKIVKELDNIMGRFEQSNSVAYTKEGAKVTLKAKLFIFEKLNEIPDEMSGFCTVNNTKYDIVHISKKLNPDATIHHIVLELI